MAELPKDAIYHYESKDGINITVTMTELVRCKDCRYNYANMIPGGKGCQQNVYIETADNWYCADGEREDGVEE